MATGSVVVGGEDGRRQGYFEVELTADAANRKMQLYVGIVKTGLDHDKHQQSSDNKAWFLGASYGSLYGNGTNGKEDYDAQGKLNVGDRVGVLVDLDGGEGGDGGSVRFFVNGSEYGPGYKSGVKGPVVLAVEIYDKGPVVTLLHDALKPVGL